VKFLRTLSTPRLFVLLVAMAVLAVGGAAVAVGASGGGGPTPPPKPLAQAIHEGLAAPEPEGITARIKFTNNLFPSGSLLGNVGSALMSGASGRLWLKNDGHGRLELQSEAGDAQIVWSPTSVTIYDASSNTVYKASLSGKRDSSSSHGDNTLPTLAKIEDFLSKLGKHADVSGAQPSDVAGQAAYTVSISPKHDGGLLGSAELAWDAARGVPLRAAIYAQGSSSPVLELKVTDISYGPVSAGDVEIPPPAGAKTVDVGSLGKNTHSNGPRTEASGLDAVRAAADFRVLAPDTLVGLPRRDVRLVGGSDSKAALVVYGHGLGAIVVVERRADVASPEKGDVLSSLPTVSLDGLTGHELATQLGTVIQWRRNGVVYVLAGSLPSAAAEAAARDLK
jgi:outer membrane lipoprotein-sorting protein